ncbi:cytochrome P450 [Mycena latifolia]|nr:cytochrome P450 [Mycena latifolia]
MSNLGLYSKVLPVLAVFAAVVLIRLRRRGGVVATIKGPSAPSWIFGNMTQLFLAHNYGQWEYQWQKQFGAVYRFKACFGEDRLMLSDPAALKYVLNTPTFTHPARILRTSALVFGESLVSFTGKEHRRLRGAMSNAFSATAVKSYLPIIIATAKKVADEWKVGATPGSSNTVNICEAIDHATLDITSEALLSMPINTVQNPDQPIARTNILSSGFNRSKVTLFSDFLVPYIPDALFKQLLNTPIEAMKAVSKFMSVTQVIMDEKTRKISPTGPESDVQDMLSIMVNGRQGSGAKISQSEAIHQIRILLIAGQDPPSVCLAWTLYHLAKDPAFQAKVREEILAAREAANGGDLDYDSLPHLTAILKESLRVYPPNPITERVAQEDSVIPLAFEVTTSTGERLTQIPVKKGQSVMVAMGSYQRLEAVWGPDAEQFRPSRWLNNADAATGTKRPALGPAVPPYAELLSFIGGQRACLGWRFGILVVQAVICELLTQFQLTLPKDSSVRARYWGTEELPVTPEGVKGVMVSVTRI